MTLGIEAQVTETSYADFDRQFAKLGPALIHITTDAGPAFLAVLPQGFLLTTDLARVRVSPAAIRSELCSKLEEPVALEIKNSLDRAQIPPSKQARARAQDR